MDRILNLSEQEAALHRIKHVPDKVFFAARNGMAINLSSLLETMNQDRIKGLLETVSDDDGERCTPLIIAAKNGHDKVVRVFLKKFPANLEQEGCVKKDNLLIEGATALWCAAGNGHLNVVKTLVRNGADVNHGTLSSSTPLRAACFDGRLDIVKYLVDHGADVSKPNKFNNSCLMYAAHRGHKDIVRYLLENNADPNQKALCGATAMHFAAECGNVDIVKDLLKFGAQVTKNDHGLTPLLAGAERTRLYVVEFLIKLENILISDKIDALELLGASFANDKDNYSMELAYEYMRRGMELRYLDPNNTISKPEYEPIAAYSYRKECKSLEELKIIRYNLDELAMESLTIRERLLGRHNSDVLHSIVFRGAVYADNSKFDRCISLWVHALHLAQINRVSVTKDLSRFSQVFSQMVFQNETFTFSHLETVLAAAIIELQRNKQKLLSSSMKTDIQTIQETMENNIFSVLYMIIIATKLKNKFTIDEQYRVHQLVHKIIKINATSRQGQTLLHLCVDVETPVDTFHCVEICRFPCAETAKLLIKCGADVNAMDNLRNTPLHIIVGYQRPVNDFVMLHYIITDLLQAGAHIDAVNAQGKTPAAIGATGMAQFILKAQLKPSLKCIAANFIKKYKIPYYGMVPKDLEAFIDLHGRSRYQCLSYLISDDANVSILPNPLGMDK